MPRLQPHARLRGQAQDLVGLLHGQRQRLLAEDVFPGVSARANRRAMKFRRCHDGHRVNIFSLDQRLDGVVGMPDFELRRNVPCAREIRVGNGDQLRLRDQAANIFSVPLAHRADTHDTHAELRQDFLRFALAPMEGYRMATGRPSFAAR